jgi:hypothetical protein
MRQKIKKLSSTAYCNKLNCIRIMEVAIISQLNLMHSIKNNSKVLIDSSSLTSS